MRKRLMNMTTQRRIGSIKIKAQYLVSIFFLAFITIASTAVGRSQNEGRFANLKVLPKNISSKKLSQIMVDEFTDALGVSCGFCHAEAKDSHRLDYASDANPQKNIARAMMKMTMKVNKQFFKVRHPLIGDSSMIITCVSCHRGTAFPYPAE